MPKDAKRVKVKRAADKVDDSAVSRQMRSEQDRQAAEKHYWVTLIRLPEDNEPSAFVGAAGVAYHMAKGVRMPVPESVINALKMAKVHSFVPVSDEATGTKRQRRVEYQRYPYQLDGEASPDEVKAWKSEQAVNARRREGLVEAPLEDDEIMGAPRIEFGQTTSVGAQD